MHLRSGACIRSGQPSTVDGRSRASTQESTARSSLPKVSEQEHAFAYEADSEDSMATNSSGSHGIGLVYNTKLTFERENIYGAQLYRDPSNQYVVKIEDHHSQFDPEPWVNYQEDRYMGRDGVMYLITDRPDEVDALGSVVNIPSQAQAEEPPRPMDPSLRLVNSIRTRHILLDDETKDLYSRSDSGTEFFYLREDPLEHSLSEEKVLYVFICEGLGSSNSPVVFLDKYHQEWTLMLDTEVGYLTYLGITVTRGGMSGVSTSRPSVYTPGNMRTPSAPPLQPRTSQSAHECHSLLFRLDKWDR